MRGVVLGMVALLLVALGGRMPPGAAMGAEEYVLGSDDVIGVTVWEHPELSRTIVVRANGQISIPPLGDMQAAGKTTSVLARDLEARIANALRLATQVTVTVVSFNSQKVYLSGQVGAPGRYAFESIPSLMDLLGQAGGLGAGADLSQIRILRQAGQMRQALNVDLARSIQTGDFSSVPPLVSGDVIFVPPTSVGSVQAGLGGETIYVGGAVARPGAVSAGAGVGLAQFLTLAGGVTPQGDLSRVLVLAPGPLSGGYVVRVDLLRDMESGRSGVTLRPGDTVWVPSREASAGYQAWSLAREALGVSRDVVNLFLIRNTLKN